MVQKERLNVIIVSDATGATAESVLTAVLVQFGAQDFNVRRHPFTRTTAQLTAIMDDIPENHCVVIFTLVAADMRATMKGLCREKGIPFVDLMGSLIDIATDVLDDQPRNVPGALTSDQEDVRRLTAAIHYTRHHDDGQGLDTVDQADLIILGVSRTGKTPTGIYLSCRKLRVANIPVVLDLPLAPEVLAARGKKVGLRMSVERLRRVRAERLRHLQQPNVPDYATEAHILREVEYCEMLYKRIPGLWTIDVTNRSIEEVSEWITHNVL